MQPVAKEKLAMVKAATGRCCFLALLMGVGCQKEPEKPPRRVGVSLLSLSNPHFQHMSQGMFSQAVTLKQHLEVEDARADAQRQDEQIREFLRHKVDGILLTACDSAAIAPALLAANAQHIPVITLDIACANPQVQILSHVATDNAEGGKLAAEAMIQKLQGRGPIGLVEWPQASSAALRITGFTARLPAQMPVVARISPQGVSRKEVETLTRQMLENHPKIQGIFAYNDISALGVLDAVEALGQSLIIIGFDGTPEAKTAVRMKRLYATVQQEPELMGKRALEILAEHLSGKPVEKLTLIAPTLYSLEDPFGPKR